MKSELRVLSPTAILGYGFPTSSFAAGIARKPDLIAVDAGSTDPGPYYLGAGKSFTQYTAVKRDLQYMLIAGAKLGIPVIVGSAGGSGARPHLEWTVNIVKELLVEHKLDMKLAVIPSDIDKPVVLDALAQDKIRPCGAVAQLTTELVEQTTNLVAQMGVEPIIAALEDGAQVIVAGRSYDPTSFAASAIMQGFDSGLALHMGKILECAAIAATPGSGSDCLMGYLQQDSFILETLNPKRSCTKISVAAHTLYEKSNPYLLPGPGGSLDLTEAVFRELGDGRVQVSGSKFIPSEGYWIKLEGARPVGYRAISIAGVRDPIMISQIDQILTDVKYQVADTLSLQENYHLTFHCYGKNGVMGELEPKPLSAHELGLVIDVVASTQEAANTICGVTRSTLLHYGYPGRKSTAGNLAFPYSPSDFTGGVVYEFSVHHLLKVDDPVSLFPWYQGGDF